MDSPNNLGPYGADISKARTTKTLLVHPFTNRNHQKEIEKPKYLLETPVELKRKQPLLEIPKDFNKKPKLYENKTEKATDTHEKPAVVTEMKNTSIQTSESDCQNHKNHCQNPPDKICQNLPVKICHHCCCRDACEERGRVSEKTCASDLSKSCGCQNQAVKVIFAPAMMPSMYQVPGMQYIMKPPVKVCEKVWMPVLYF